MFRREKRLTPVLDVVCCQAVRRGTSEVVLGQGRMGNVAMKSYLLIVFLLVTSTAWAQLTFIAQTNSLTATGYIFTPDTNASPPFDATPQTVITNSNIVGDFTAQVTAGGGSYQPEGSYSSGTASLTVTTNSGTLSVQGSCSGFGINFTATANSSFDAVFTVQTAQMFTISGTVNANADQDGSGAIASESLSDTNGNALWALQVGGDHKATARHLPRRYC
jgi:hypothetical protein